MKRIFTYTVEGKAALAFDTGLSAQAFAQARMAQFITERGVIVSVEGRNLPARQSSWKSEGVVEAAGGTMLVWGPAFDGELLLDILDAAAGPDGGKDAAIAAILRWTEARRALGFESNAPLWSAACLIGKGEDAGRVLFPPAFLCGRCLEADDAVIAGREAYTHPALKGEEAAAFTLAVMLYRVFGGRLPFGGDNSESEIPLESGIPLESAVSLETLHQNMTEAVFLPAELAAPGLDPKLAALINQGLGMDKKAARPAFAALIETLAAAPENGFVKPPDAAALASVEAEKARWLKRKGLSVKSRRFVVRNAVIIGAAAAIGVIVLLVVYSIVDARKNLPTTKGMTSRQVVEAYYESFNTLDQQVMEACVYKDAGKSDLMTVTQFYVTSKVRQAYEAAAVPLLPAPQWLAQGGKAVDVPVFGVTGLEIEETGSVINDDEASRDNVTYRARYTLWYPGQTPEGQETGVPQPVKPAGNRTVDNLTLIRVKGDWRISAIERRAEPE